MLDSRSDSDLSPEQRYDRLRRLPPSAKLVYLVLEADGPLTQAGLCDETRLPARTVRYALSRLDEESLITKDISLCDARRHHYTAQPTAKPD